MYIQVIIGLRKLYDGLFFSTETLLKLIKLSSYRTIVIPKIRTCSISLIYEH